MVFGPAESNRWAGGTGTAIASRVEAATGSAVASATGTSGISLRPGGSTSSSVSGDRRQDLKASGATSYGQPAPSDYTSIWYIF